MLKTVSPQTTSNLTSFTHEEISRYSRHLIMPEVGIEGQGKLKQAKVLLIGAGGLGSPIAMYLAAAGVGTLGLVDFDIVDYSNLQRQIIHGTEDVGKLKLLSAKNSLNSINPFVKVVLHQEPITSENALEIIKDYDIVCDGTDNFPTRYLVNDACVMLGKPNVFGSIFRFEGQVSVFDAEKGPCYRCLYSNPPPPGLVPSCAEGGVFGVLPGIIGTIQATEIIKLILEEGDPLIGRLLLFDALDMEFKQLKIRKNNNCIVCGDNPTVTELIDYEEFCGVPVIGDLEGPVIAEYDLITVKEFDKLRQSGTSFKLVDVREVQEREINEIPNSILIPKNQIENHLDELDKNELIIFYCKSGIRSANIVLQLKQQGYINIRSLIGGINAYASIIDPSIPQY